MAQHAVMSCAGCIPVEADVSARLARIQTWYFNAGFSTITRKAKTTVHPNNFQTFIIHGLLYKPVRRMHATGALGAEWGTQCPIKDISRTSMGGGYIVYMPRLEVPRILHSTT
eukprot:scpid95962/ scgid34416/ 